MSGDISVTVTVNAKGDGKRKGGLVPAILLRLRPEMLKEIKVMAEKEDRSLANMSVRLIQEAMDQRSRK